MTRGQNAGVRRLTRDRMKDRMVTQIGVNCNRIMGFARFVANDIRGSV
jgi:hypothetical protein